MMEFMNISTFPGTECVKEKIVGYKGNPVGVQEVVGRCLEVVQRYARLIGSGDFEAAYALTDPGLQSAMPFKRFVSEHERAAQEYGGPAREFRINEIAYVFSDDAARKKSKTSAEGWFKGTAKEARRGRVLGFWIRNPSTHTGCGGALWIAAEGDNYRIAKFDFWRP